MLPGLEVEQEELTGILGEIRLWQFTGAQQLRQQREAQVRPGSMLEETHKAEAWGILSAVGKKEDQECTSPERRHGRVVVAVVIMG